MIGYNYIIVFNQNGKIQDYQKAYNSETAKTINLFLPLCFNNKKQYRAELSIAVNNTFPKQIITVCGKKAENDLNKYIFDLTAIYSSTLTKNKYGLCKFKLLSDNGRVKFESESFRI